MSLFEKIWVIGWGTLGLLATIYWGNLAWFHPDKLKQRLIERAKKHPDWLFIKGYNLKFSNEHGVSLMRFTTLMVVLMLLIVALIIALNFLKGVK